MGEPGTPPDDAAARARKLARLARLDLDEAALREREADLEAILAFVGQLRGLDLDGVRPLTHPLEGVMDPDPDETRAGLPNDALMRMAPDAEPPFLRVPKVIDGGGSS
jgi:aspartyl-tRNA(Asn)/glutamyl-tRNA(Gln) amidotransferase subunit C